MTHARIPDFSQPVPVRVAASARRPLPVDRRYIAMPDETQTVLPEVAIDTPEVIVLPWRGRGNIIAAAGVALLDLARAR
jgi:hypothetical protein